MTIFFEIGPYGDLSSYDNNGREAMFGVGEVSINRWRNDDRVQNVNNHGEQAKGGIIAVIKESDAWHHETYNGSGTLLEGQRNRFYNVLNGDPNSLDCKGLIGSWMIGQSIIYQYYGTANVPPSIYTWSQVPAQNALFYGSSSYGNVTLPGVSTANSQYVQAAGSWSVPKFPSGSYLENFFRLTNAQSRAGYPPFI